MDDFTNADLKELVEQDNPHCISIFMPTYRKGDAEQNTIRLKNQIRKAEDKLRSAGVRSPESYMDQAKALLNDPSFWEEVSDGLALFLSDGFFRVYRLPVQFTEFMHLNNRFYIKPVLPLFGTDGVYYILALSQNKIRFFRASRYTVDEIEPREMPTSLAEAMKYDYMQQQLQFTTQTMSGVSAGGVSPGTRRGAMFHGQGVGTDDAKNRILRYFQEVDKGVHEMIGQENRPLVLAGVEYLLPIYREASTYKQLVEDGVEGNPDQVKASELHQSSWKIVEPLFHRGFEEAKDKYAQFEGTGNTSKSVEEILAAAAKGRVETLFVALGLRQWGRFDPETHTAELVDSEEESSEDLLDTAALQTLFTGGKVYAVQPESVPGASPVAAVFRYPLPG
ncbi:MAG: hypothetical protein ACOC24_02125 [Desulfovibrionales bacterium]